MLLRAGLVLLAAWAVVAFAQEAWTANRLNADAAGLRGRNAVLQSQNNDYRRDILAVQSGGAAEEVARQNGYSRPDERLYLVSAPPPQPVATAAPKPKAATVHDQSTSPVDALKSWLSSLGNRGRRS